VGVFWTFLAVAAGYGAVMWGLVRFARFARRRGIDGSLMNVVDEIYHPIAFESQHETQVQEQRLAPRRSDEDR